MISLSEERLHLLSEMYWAWCLSWGGDEDPCEDHRPRTSGSASRTGTRYIRIARMTSEQPPHEWWCEQDRHKAPTHRRIRPLSLQETLLANDSFGKKWVIH